jgi:hypothetical protein
MKIKKNGKVINLTESDLKRIVKRTLNEQEGNHTEIVNMLNSLPGEYKGQSNEQMSKVDKLLRDFNIK